MTGPSTCDDPRARVGQMRALRRASWALLARQSAAESSSGGHPTNLLTAGKVAVWLVVASSAPRAAGVASEHVVGDALLGLRQPLAE